MKGVPDVPAFDDEAEPEKSTFENMNRPVFLPSRIIVFIFKALNKIANAWACWQSLVQLLAARPQAIQFIEENACKPSGFATILVDFAAFGLGFEGQKSIWLPV